MFNCIPEFIDLGLCRAFWIGVISGTMVVYSMLLFIVGFSYPLGMLFQMLFQILLSIYAMSLTDPTVQ